MSCARTIPGVLASMLLCTGFAHAQIDQLPHADMLAGNFFGTAVAIDDQRILVGASGENSCLEDAGAAYIFELDPASLRWRSVARLVAADCEERRFFGRRVALSGDRALVAAANEPGMRRMPDVAYVFERNAEGYWQQQATLTTGATFRDGTTGTTVALQGNVAVLTTWGDISTGQHGGAAYIFTYDAARQAWEQAERIVGSGGIRYGVFGGDAAMDAHTLVVPSSRYLANKSGSAYIFEKTPRGSWKEARRIDEVDDFFISVDVDDSYVLVGSSRAGSDNRGAATLYSRNAVGQWHRTAEFEPPTPYQHGAFGSLVALSGDRALVAGFDEQLQLDINIDRVVYVYALDADSGVWGYQGIIDIGQVAFGSAIDLEDHYAVIGAASEHAPGTVYVVRIP